MIDRTRIKRRPVVNATSLPKEGWISDTGKSSSRKVRKARVKSKLLTNVAKLTAKAKRRVKVKKAKSVNPVRFDPSKTATLQRGMLSQLRKQFALLKGAIVKLVEVDDAFGLANRVTANQSLQEKVDQAAKEAEPNPTPDQIEAGNYKKGHVTIQGLPITIETAAGNKRKPWHDRPIAYHYGYIKQTESEADGDHVDVFLGPHLESEVVFIIDQRRRIVDNYEGQSRDVHGRFGSGGKDLAETGKDWAAVKHLFPGVEAPLFHATTGGKAIKIVDEGLVSGGASDFGKGNVGSVSMTTNLDWATAGHRGNYIFVIDEHELKDKGIIRQHQDPTAENEYERRFEGNIPQASIKGVIINRHLGKSERDEPSEWPFPVVYNDKDKGWTKLPKGVSNVRSSGLENRADLLLLRDQQEASGDSSPRILNRGPEYLGLRKEVWQYGSDGTLVNSLRRPVDTEVVGSLEDGWEFDEHKCMIGFLSSEEAKAAYFRNYSDDWKGFAGIKAVTMSAFKEWVHYGTGTPIKDQLIYNSDPDGDYWLDQATGFQYVANADQPRDSNGRWVKVGDNVLHEKQTYTVTGGGQSPRSGPNKGRFPTVLRHTVTGKTKIAFADELLGQTSAEVSEEAMYVPVGKGQVDFDNRNNLSIQLLDKIDGNVRDEVLGYRKERRGESELKKVKLKDITPSQEGDDRINDSSRESAKAISSGRLSQIARADIAPIILDSSNKIVDGNHRFSAAQMNGQTLIYAWVQHGPAGNMLRNVEPEQSRLIEVDDVRQPNHYFCGAAAVTSVAHWFGWDLDKDVYDIAEELGTTLQKSTDPQSIVGYFEGKEGSLVRDSMQSMTLDELRNYTEKGMPVIVCVQDYGDRREVGASFNYGHFLTVIGVGYGYVFCQDSSLENFEKVRGGDTPKDQEQPYNIDAPGRIMVHQDEFLHVWHDKDVNDRPYIRWGCAVGRASQVANYSEDQLRDDHGKWTAHGSKFLMEAANAIEEGRTKDLASIEQRARAYAGSQAVGRQFGKPMSKDQEAIADETTRAANKIKEWISNPVSSKVKSDPSIKAKKQLEKYKQQLAEAEKSGNKDYTEVLKDEVSYWQKLVGNYSPDQPRDSQGRFGTGIGALAQPLAKAKDVMDKIPGAKWMREKTAQIVQKLTDRYGSKQAMAIVASGQAFGWGLTVGGTIMTGVPVYVPFSTIVGMVPGAALAEVAKQLRDHRDKPMDASGWKGLQSAYKFNADRLRDSHGRFTRDLESHEIEKLSEWREHLWNRETITSLTKKTITGGELEHLHPGEITVYRGRPEGSKSASEAKGTSWTKSKKVAEKWAEGGRVESRDLTKDDAALDVGKALKGVPSKSSHEQEVFVVNEELTQSQVGVLGQDLVNELMAAWRDKPPAAVINAGRYEFHVDADKIQAFQDWLKTQFRSTITGKTQEQLWDAYIKKGFDKGVGRMFDDLDKSKINQVPFPDSGDPSPPWSEGFYRGTKEEFIRSAFAQPINQERVKLMAGRAFDDLEGVTDDMSLKMSRSLTDSLIAGDSPHDAAKDLVEQVDISRRRAEVIARTEIIRAHAEGQLTALEQMGVEEVGVAVEWQTTGVYDGPGKVCELCQSLEGVVLKIDEARGLLPKHPCCRCCFLPAHVGEDDADQKDTKKEIDSALEEAGIDDVDISKTRPQSILNTGETYDQAWERLIGNDSSFDEHHYKVSGGELPDYLADFARVLENAFCPTGPGGGVDPTCSVPKAKSKKGPKAKKEVKQFTADVKQPVNLSPAEQSLVRDKISDALYADQKGTAKMPTVADIATRQLENETTVTSAVKDAVSKVKAGRDKYDIPSMGDVFDQVIKDLPGLTIDDFHSAVAKLSKSGEVRLATYTRAIGQLERPEFAMPAEGEVFQYINNAFCPTGPGGGVDPTCSPQRTPRETKVALLKTLRYGMEKLDEDSKVKYLKTALKVVEAMPEKAQRDVEAWVQKAHFYSNIKDLNGDLHKRLGTDDEQLVGGIYANKEKAVYLDGEGEGSGTTKTAEGTYAHEFTHALDWANGRVSGKEPWQKAWQDEMVTPKLLSAYGRTKASEGFAEFGRALYGSGGKVTPDDLAKAFPGCSQIYKENGLWPGTGS